MNTDNIKLITVKGYDSSEKTYKLQLDFEKDADGRHVQSQKIFLKWTKIIKAFRHIKKELNKDIYAKLLYTLCTSIIIKDKHYRTTQEFLYGVPLKKNIRKISDVQAVLNFLLNSKKEGGSDSQAIDCIFKHAFNMLE
jgi:hypothetical protein